MNKAQQYAASLVTKHHTLWEKAIERSQQYQSTLGLSAYEVEKIGDQNMNRGWPTISDQMGNAFLTTTLDDGTVIGLQVECACTPQGWKHLIFAGMSGEHPAELQDGRGTTLVFIIPDAYHRELLDALKHGAYQMRS